MTAAFQVQAETAKPFAPVRPGLLQRKCACGGSPGLDGECEECRATRIQRKPAYSTGSDAAAPPIVDDVLRSPGQPLDTETRAFMESRLGHRFGDVRIHTDARAERSAQAVNAVAYTVGQDIVFGPGQYAPHSARGRELLAHELVHAVQQSVYAGGSGPLSVGPVDDAHEREADAAAQPIRGNGVGEADARARFTSNAPIVRRQPDPAGQSVGPGGDIFTLWFDWNSTQLRPDSQKQLDAVVAQAWRHIRTLGSAARVNLRGYASTDGDEKYNLGLSKRRADIVKTLLMLAGIPEGYIAVVGFGESSAYPSDLKQNRRVEAELGTVVPGIRPPAPTPPAKKFVCGPNITEQLSGAVYDVQIAFNTWNQAQREESCFALVSLALHSNAWDIGELHNSDWIYDLYRPQCATEGANPPCGHSVQVNDQCYYAGSANYVIFGTMCKLCYGHFSYTFNKIDPKDPLSNGPLFIARMGLDKFNRKAMLTLINDYKGTGSRGTDTPSGNFQLSIEWAAAGYDGWPNGGSPPSGDRSNCQPTCRTPNIVDPFSIQWYPNLKIYARIGIRKP